MKFWLALKAIAKFAVLLYGLPMKKNVFDLATELGNLLLEHQAKVTVAESCTGGGIGAAITAVAGSSNWFDVGYITYSNQAKIGLLGVSASLIESAGAVSIDVAAAMVAGALRISGANYGIAVSGIAGPTGAVPGKPVGSVCFGWGRYGQVQTESCIFQGSRNDVREAAVVRALILLIEYIQKDKNTV